MFFQTLGKKREFIVAPLYEVLAQGLFLVQIESKTEKDFPLDFVRFLLRRHKFKVL